MRLFPIISPTAAAHGELLLRAANNFHGIGQLQAGGAK